QGPAGFHRALASKLGYRPAFVSVLVSALSAQLPVRLTLLDASGRSLGGAGAQGKIVKDIPYSDYMEFATNGATTSQMAMVATPDAGNFTIALTPTGAPPAPFTISV